MKLMQTTLHHDMKVVKPMKKIANYYAKKITEENLGSRNLILKFFFE